MSTNTAQQSAGKLDLFQLTSFESSLEPQEASLDVTPMVFDEGFASDKGMKDLRKRVEGLLGKLRENSKSEDIPSSFLREQSSMKSSQIASKVDGLMEEIARLSSSLQSKQVALEQVTAENSLLLRKLSRLTDLIQHYELEHIAPETIETVPTCQGCNLL